MLRFLRAGVGLLLGFSGALMCTASAQRWAGACAWGDNYSELCDLRQDHLYDFIAPEAPWEPIGTAAQLAGVSLLVLALAYVLLPWALNGRRPEAIVGVVWAIGVAALVSVGVATLISGLTGIAVHPVGDGLALFAWYFVPAPLLIWFSLNAHGLTAAAGVALVLSSPFVAAAMYGIGPYDARPWSEAIRGTLTTTAGVLLLADATLLGTRRPRKDTSAASDTDHKAPAPR